MNKTEQKISAETTLSQIGKGTLSELRAKNFVYGDHFVQFSVSASDYNKVVVIYDESADLYNVQLWNIDMELVESKLVSEYKGVYCDELSGLVARERISELMREN